MQKSLPLSSPTFSSDESLRVHVVFLPCAFSFRYSRKVARTSSRVLFFLVVSIIFRFLKMLTQQ